ncbi:MAG: cob(I)yrinic acid a,c-diamide adenosyltransferase [Nitrospirota bacterium]
MTKNKSGLLHIYTGEGKGKTTAAIGLAVRAAGNGMKVLFVQFLKGGEESGELKIFKNLQKNIEVIRFDQRHPIFFEKGDTKEGLIKAAKEALKLIAEKIKSGKYNLVVLDEINNLVSQGWADVNELMEIIKKRPEGVEIVLTGRGASKELIDMADYVTEVKAIKHPFKKGIKARKGIEY